MNQLKSIVVGVDFSDCSRSALHQAVRIAQWNQAHLHVVHVIEYLVISDLADALGHTIARIQADAVRHAKGQLEAWLAEFGPSMPRSVDVLVGPPIDGILRKVQSTEADLLVLGVHGDSMLPASAGTLATKCVRKAPCKVMLVEARHARPFQTVVACVDFSELSREAVAQALRVAAQDQSHVYFLHVFDGPWKRLPYCAKTLETATDFQHQYRTRLEQRLKEFVGDTPPGVVTHFAVFNASNFRCGIAEYARPVRADLVVLGTKGRTNLKYMMLGSTVERLLRDVPCSVLTVKPCNEGVRVPFENQDQPQ
ncbi:MAG: universal stress protein [Verrucomicrobia bacterium]|nr:universal stress protein [Verrucomicrobiota bacterium]